MEIALKKPLYCLSKKYYAGGEVVLEFITLDNKDDCAKAELTFKTKEIADMFDLKKEYEIKFKPV
jgi:hypothetical protein